MCFLSWDCTWNWSLWTSAEHNSPSGSWEYQQVVMCACSLHSSIKCFSFLLGSHLLTSKYGTNSLNFQSFTHRKCNLQSNKFKNYSVLSGFQHLLFCFATATLDTLIFLDEKQKQFHIHHVKKMNFILKLVNENYQDFYSHVENNNIIAKEYQTNVLFTLSLLHALYETQKSHLIHVYFSPPW